MYMLEVLDRLKIKTILDKWVRCKSHLTNQFYEVELGLKLTFNNIENISVFFFS